MSWEYSCPQCHAMLNPDRSVILAMSHGDVDCLVGLNPQPGKYEVHLPPQVTTADGTRWNFSCPMCKRPLATEEDPSLCELALTVDGDPLRIFFSSVAGEHATFVMHETTVREKFGEDAARYNPETRKARAEQG
ncbi:MAG: hypothetical protein GY838_05215 [bacterium]|nr:hypothetical protein [bacterium]